MLKPARALLKKSGQADPLWLSGFDDAFSTEHVTLPPTSNAMLYHALRALNASQLAAHICQLPLRSVMGILVMTATLLHCRPDGAFNAFFFSLL